MARKLQQCRENIYDNTLGISVIKLGKNKGNRLIIDSSNKNLYKLFNGVFNK